MDIAIPRKNRKKQYIALSILGFLAIITAGIYLATRPSSLNIKKEEVQIKAVKYDSFEDFVVFQAQVDPLHAMLINIVEGGAVQELFVENGAMVTQGMPLARLYNPNTEFNFLSQETAIIEQMNNLNVQKLSLRNQELELSKELITIDHDYNDTKLQYDMNQKLYSNKVLAKNEWEQTQEKHRYQEERKNLIQKNISREKEVNQIQIAQINQALQAMHKSLETLRENKKNFLVLAPVSGRLSSFDAVLGQTYQAGTSIGKVDVMKGYKLMALIDEFYLEKINSGQTGNIEMKGKSVPVRVSKILPEVKNGQFKIELDFTDKQPEGLQQGLSFGVKLILSGKEKKLVIPKGTFSNVSQGKWIFVVEGNKANRRSIELGRENPYYYEVISGLKEGDRIITSGYEDYKNIQLLNLN
ncbi:efflux RND transporter periplasmic adaptor subunit [Sphingobacterium spiritivorum]|uniref:efflux RND transporter periplasmic adaptor subunit n=1 Tax=Sphingobacterium spiritivorum TaxID=258 RepID=UPI003DA1DCAE